MRIGVSRNALLFTLALAAATAIVFAQSGEKRMTPTKPANGAAMRGSAARGKNVFDQQCGVCHYTATDAKKIGPGLKGLMKRGKYADERPIDDASLKDWIEKGGKNMPSFKEVLKPENIRDLVAYLKTL